MGTPSSRPRSGCCGLCLLCCSTAVARQSSSRALQRKREGRRRAEIAIFHSRGGPGPRTNPQLRSVCIAAIVPYYANVVAWSHPVIEPVSHALAPLSAHIHWKGKGFIGNVWRGH